MSSAITEYFGTTDAVRNNVDLYTRFFFFKLLAIGEEALIYTWGTGRNEMILESYCII